MKPALIALCAAAALAVAALALHFRFPASPAPAIRSAPSLPASASPPAAPGGSVPPPASLIPLREGETLLHTLSADLDGDGEADAVSAVTRPEDEGAVIIAGLPGSGPAAFERSAEIAAGILPGPEFSLSCLDITGTHRNALAVSGSRPGGIAALRLYHVSRRAGRLSFQLIGDFASDGTIFIQTLERDDSYTALESAGTPFPVWVYGSAPPGADGRPAQAQTMYGWDAKAGRYTQASQTLTAGGAGGAAPADAAAFARFLDGVWVKSAGNAGERVYLGFDPARKEIIFLYEGGEEVFSWERSVYRRNGAFISSVNASVQNLSRQIDLAVTGAAEITVRVQDDVRMIISGGAVWDGVYSRLTAPDGAGEGEAAYPADMYAALTEEAAWRAGEGEAAFSGGRYRYAGETGTEEGRFALLWAGGPAIEFRPDGAAAFFGKAYRIERDGAGFLLRPAELTAEGTRPLSLPPLRLTPPETAGE